MLTLVYKPFAQSRLVARLRFALYTPLQLTPAQLMSLRSLESTWVRLHQPFVPDHDRLCQPLAAAVLLVLMTGRRLDRVSCVAYVAACSAPSTLRSCASRRVSPFVRLALVLRLVLSAFRREIAPLLATSRASLRRALV